MDTKKIETFSIYDFNTGDKVLIPLKKLKGIPKIEIRYCTIGDESLATMLWLGEESFYHLIKDIVKYLNSSSGKVINGLILDFCINNNYIDVKDEKQSIDDIIKANNNIFNKSLYIAYSKHHNMVDCFFSSITEMFDKTLFYF